MASIQSVIADAIRESKNARKGRTRFTSTDDQAMALTVIAAADPVVRTALHKRADACLLDSGLIAYIHDEIDNCLDRLLTDEEPRWR